MNQVDTPIKKSLLLNDLLASLTGFLVALTLSLGIAIASGVPPGLGIVSAIVGCFVSFLLTGSILMITGPAAGLIAITMGVVHEFGFEKLGLIVMLSGLIQTLCGVMRLGQIFRAITPAVIHGMMAGIGLIIITGQFHVMFDIESLEQGVSSLLHFPSTLASAIPAPLLNNHSYAGIISTVTILTLLLWRFFPKPLKVVPSTLYGVGIGILMANLFHWPVNFIAVPARLIDNIHWIHPTDLLGINSHILIAAVAMAAIGSAKALLTANAVDHLHDLRRSENNKEMISQGVGNTIAGILGSIPISGEILRSTINVNTGARSRLAGLLIGLWLLLFSLFCPDLLEMIPKCTLAALLVYTGVTLINPHHIKALGRFGQVELFIYFTTALGVVFIDPLEGVILGVILGFLNLTFRLSKLYIDTHEEDNAIEVSLRGRATFLTLPKLVVTMDSVTGGKTVHLNIKHLDFIDSACYDFLLSWANGYTQTGGNIITDWPVLESMAIHAQKVTIAKDCIDPLILGQVKF